MYPLLGVFINQLSLSIIDERGLQEWQHDAMSLDIILLLAVLPFVIRLRTGYSGVHVQGGMKLWTHVELLGIALTCIKLWTDLEQLWICLKLHYSLWNCTNGSSTSLNSIEQQNESKTQNTKTCYKHWNIAITNHPHARGKKNKNNISQTRLHS